MQRFWQRLVKIREIDGMNTTHKCVRWVQTHLTETPMFPIRDHNPSGRTPYVTYALVLANVAVFVMTLVYFQTDRDLAKLYYHYGMIPARLASGDNITGLFSSMFLHAGFMHLAGNMLFLWIFGDNMEDEMGHFGFLVFYVACGAAAAFAQFAAAPGSQVPTVGASGAIAGVMGGYLLLFPRARVDILIIFIVFFRIFPIPAWIVLGIWFAIQTVSGLSAAPGSGGVAYWAHAGGFAAGILLTLRVWLRLGGVGFWKRWDGHPPHPEAKYQRIETRIPQVRRKR